MLTALGALPFFLYVAVFLLLPIGVLAVEAFRATDPVTFEESWSTDIIVAITEGAYRRAYLGSLQLSADHRRARRACSGWRSPSRCCAPAGTCCCGAWC